MTSLLIIKLEKYSFKINNMSLDVNMSEPDEFNCQELHSCIKNVANIKGIEDFGYHVDYICGKGDNFIANVFRVVIKDSCGDEDKQVNVIIKTLVNTLRQELFNDLHKREVAVYRDIIPYYKKLQDTYSIEDRLILPECLFSSSENGREVLVFEDLMIDGYEMDGKLSRFEYLTFEDVNKVFRELAKLHALYIACEKEYSDEFSKIKIAFGDIIFQEEFLNKSKISKYMYESFEMFLRELSDSEAKKKLQSIEHKLFEILRLYTKPRKYNVLCHGDFWMNNILFKRDENNSTKICILDFQTMRYASPATDIIYFLYLCTDSKFRSDHLDTLQNVYHDSLKSILLLFNIDVNLVYPKDEFLNEMNELLPFGLLMALIELRIMTTTPEDEAILKGANSLYGLGNAEVPGEIGLFKIRVNDVVKESVENGTLDRLIETIQIYV